MTDYKATPEQWTYAEQCALNNDAFLACILELRNRIEALEASAAKGSDHIGKVNKMVNSSARLTSFNHPEKPDSSLVERVRCTIGHTYSDDARAAIREVAAWLRESEDWNEITIAHLLEQEAER